MILPPTADALIHDLITGRAPIAVVCAWCPDAPERTAEARRAGHSVTHGLCPACAARLEDLAGER